MPKKQRINSRQAGFTLLETVIAALILTIGIVFVAQIFITAMKQNQTSRQFTHATAIAQSKIEELNAVPLEALRYGGELGLKREDGDRKGEEGYFEYVAVDRGDDKTIGVVATREEANYIRFWKIEPDPDGWIGVYRISVRAVSLKANDADFKEDVTLSTIRTQY